MKMFGNSLKLFLIVIFQVALLGRSEKAQEQGREYHGYYLSEEEKRPDYQGYSYPGYYPPNQGYSECDKNPLLPMLGKGLSLLLLKFGVLGIIKAVVSLTFLAFLIKLPFIFLKLAFLKSFFLPFLAAPFLINLLTQQMTQQSEDSTEQKPGEITMNDAMMGMEGMAAESGRQITNNLSSMAWQSVKMLAESDQCIEKISCIIGASNNDSSIGTVFSRMLKHLQHSSPPALQERMTVIREAFKKGSQTATCSAEEYKCNSPELIIQHGTNKVKII